MKRIIATLLLLAMMITICACGNNDAAGNTPNPNNDNASQESGDKIDAGAMILTQMGTVPEDVEFVSGGIVVKYEEQGANKKVQILNQNGTSFGDAWYDDVDSIIDNGICIVSNMDANGNNLLGVVDSLKEKELLPCEAIEIQMLSDRFLLVCYMTDAGTSEDRFGTYYLGVESFDYKGYGKILDLEKGQIVSGVEVKTSKHDVSAAGNMIFVENAYPTTNVYDAEGKLMGSYEHIYAYPESNLAMQSTTEGICVYDQDMNLVSTLERKDYNDQYKPIDGISNMLLHEYVKDDHRYCCVTDLNGKALTAEYDRILSVYPDGYLSISENGKNCIVDFEGNTIIAEFNTARYAEPGYFVASIQDEGYYVYDLSGKNLNETAMADGYSGLLLKDDSGSVFVFKTGKMLSAEGYPQEQTGSLVLIGATLYDIISGKAVLDDVESCVTTGGNLYVWDSESETYTRFLAEFKPTE